jgi:uracil-DNA glycosylase family 4
MVSLLYGFDFGAWYQMAMDTHQSAGSYERVVDLVSQYFVHAEEEGRDSVEVSAETLKALKDAPLQGLGGGLDAIACEVRACTKCPLHKTRTNAVPGQGCTSPEIAFIGDAPDRDEDEQGLAFVGKAGELLTKMINAMGLTREDVFIGSILKCRPPDDRAPMPDEMALCMPYLRAQLAILKPKVIVVLGSTATKSLLALDTGTAGLRGKWNSFEGIDLMPTFHPDYLLRRPSSKRDAWEDLKAVLAKVGRTPPSAKK